MIYFTEDGRWVQIFGLLSITGEFIHGVYESEDGDFGAIDLALTHGPGSFSEELISGRYQLELFDPDLLTVRIGVIHIDRYGLVYASEIGAEPVVAGSFEILDSELGYFQGILILLSGEEVIIEGLTGFSNVTMAGLYDDDFTLDGSASLVPF